MPVVDRVPELTALPEPPLHELVVVGEGPPGPPGFLRRLSRQLRVAGAAGAAGDTFAYDEVDRRALDAVVVAPYFFAETVGGGREAFVVLRSALRPPLALRSQDRSPIVESANRALWELPAGLVESEEISPEGLVRAAQRELFEETGFRAELEALWPLGPSAFPCPGVIAERQFYFRVEVASGEREQPALDGSPLEAIGSLVAVPLRVALSAARAGQLADAKTELGLRRLKEILE